MNDLKQQQNEKIDNLKDKLLEKIQTIISLVNNIQQLKMDITQHDIEIIPNEFDQSKKYTKLDNRNTNIQNSLLHINTDDEDEDEDEDEEEEEEEEVEDSDNEQKKKEQDSTILKFHGCNEMTSIISYSTLKNRVDFLLVTENNKKIKFQNNEWCNYNFG
ncbi:hypothetical protein RFI_39909, partial [Reticulomyxa filosa]